MKFKLFLSSMLFAASMACTPGLSQAEVFEMRTYTCNEGKLGDLLTRFRDHTCALFEKHGMTNVGYFTPTEDGNLKLVYFLSYPSREARETSWKGFLSDPDWKAAFKASRENGALITKVESEFLVPTDYSPQLKEVSKEGEHLYELRTYTATPGHLSNLDARFRDHTIELFAKHGIENIIYFHKMNDQPGAENTLVYLIRHKSEADRGDSFKAFSQDPAWKQARAESEKNAGGPLTVKGGVKHIFIAPTDFSALK